MAIKSVNPTPQVTFQTFMTIEDWLTQIDILSDFYGGSSVLYLGPGLSPIVRRSNPSSNEPVTIAAFTDYMELKTWATRLRTIKRFYGPNILFSIISGPIPKVLLVGQVGGEDDLAGGLLLYDGSTLLHEMGKVISVSGTAKTIINLPNVGLLNGTEIIVIVQGSATKKTALSNMDD